MKRALRILAALVALAALGAVIYWLTRRPVPIPDPGVAIDLAATGPRASAGWSTS